ncbi:hypothetical protein LPJ53_002950 [Coemansia erecta]|uniref:PROP1-like PPR domain-containing protein n=1 Tax=Coemansia erecta TaxID=147472 RepID=A0A9W7Y097_9FUNG|nr:hypothetical protein LPJ53_002950 [Coemansia erecta]
MLRIASGSAIPRCGTVIYTSLQRQAGLAVSSKLLSMRAFSASIQTEGHRRQYRDHSRYPRPRSTRPYRPAKIADDLLAGDQLGTRSEDKGSLLERVRVTDDEVNKIYDSIMGAGRRKERDEQSLRHNSRAEYVERRREARERLSGKSSAKSISNDRTDSRGGYNDHASEASHEGDTGQAPAKGELISEKTMEEMIYVDTRSIRELESVRRDLIASADTLTVSKLKERVDETSVSKDDSESADTEALVADLAPELSVKEFNHVIFANTIAGRLDEAVGAYDLLLESGVEPNQTTFANLTAAYAKAGDLETAIKMFKKLEDHNLEPTLYSYGTLIKAYTEFDRVDDAFRVYEAMKTRSMWPNLPVYNSLIVSCLKIGDYKRAWGVFEHLRYTIAKPDEISFSLMIHACAKNGEVEKAMNLFDEMVSNKLALSDVTFNSLIHACAVRPDYFDEGFRLLQLMEAHGFQPDFYTYNTLIYACARKKNLGLARDIFRDMLEKSMDPKKKGLLKIDPVTITNMMWAYSGYLYNVKTCSWKMAKKYESLAMDVLQSVKSKKDNPSDHGAASRILTNTEHKFDVHAGILKLIEAQERAAKATSELLETKTEGVPKDTRDKMYMNLIDMLMPKEVPSAHNGVGSEASRLMRYYLDVLGGSVSKQLLNAYLSAMIGNGRFEEAWRVFLGDFEKYGIPKDGWTFQRMLRLCARTRDVPSAWRIWDEYKAWRADVEKALGTPGHEKLKRSQTMVYRSSPDRNGKDEPSASELSGDDAALNRASKDMLALAEALEFPGDNALPTIVAGGALAVIPSDREIARRKIGCDMKTEHATYIEMVTLLGSCSDFRSAVRLIREEKSGILEHKHNPTMDDVNSLYQNAVMAGDKHAALDIRGLCMQKQAHAARRALHRKWGTSFSWDLTDPQRKSLSRRFPEEFRRHTEPFKDGERVSLRQR